MPAVVGQRRVIEQVRLDHPVHLHVLEVRGDALEESLADVSVVLGRIRLSIMYRGASPRPTTVSRARPVILVVGVGDREFIIKRVINAENPGSNVDLVMVIGAPAEAV